MIMENHVDLTAEQSGEARSSTAARKGRVAEFAPELVRDISEKVYRCRLEQESGDGAAARMIEKDGDGGRKLRNRAASYDSLTRAYLKILGFKGAA